jgi:hypothetical protein
LQLLGDAQERGGKGCESSAETWKWLPFPHWQRNKEIGKCLCNTMANAMASVCPMLLKCGTCRLCMLNSSYILTVQFLVDKGVNLRVNSSFG